MLLPPPLLPEEASVRQGSSHTALLNDFLQEIRGDTAPWSITLCRL